MPYTKSTLTQGTSDEMKGILDAAITASGKYSKVTSAYVSGNRSYDVWLNDGTTDGYQWYLVVCTDTGNPGRVLLGGCLEYDDPTKIAKKALRGYNTTGFVGTTGPLTGYPLDAAGGNELTFALGGFTVTSILTSGVLGAASNMPAAAAAGNILRVLVTGRVVWIHWGTATTPTYCHGVGTYDRLHPNTTDAKPLGFIASNSVTAGTTAWQHPNATHATNSRTSASLVLGTALSSFDFNLFTVLAGQVGSGDATPDILWNGVYVGSRFHIVRVSGSTPQSGGTTSVATAGYSIGLAPDDFLLFARKASVLTGDTITYNSRTYEMVSPGGFAIPGLFVNTSA